MALVLYMSKIKFTLLILNWMPLDVQQSNLAVY